MTNKDKMLLENAYSSISQNSNDEREHYGKLEFLKQEIIKRKGSQMPVDKLIDLYHKLEQKDPEMMQVKIGDFKRDILGNFFDQKETQDSSIGDDEYPENFDEIKPKNSLSDMSYAKKGGYVKFESFVHGIQPITEAKKKELPLALKKAIEKKTGKKFGKKNKDEPTKGFKKLAKKTNKKVTSDKIKSKNK
jgi:hypothetical protein